MIITLLSSVVLVASRSIRFASWSSNTWGNGTFSVILYSNQHKEEDIFLSIDLLQILRYGEKFYEHLKVLGHTLNRQYEMFAREKRAETIPSSKVDHSKSVNALLRAFSISTG